MRTYRDAQNHEWTLSIDIATAKRLRAVLQLDINDLTNDNQRDFLQRLADPIFMADVLFVTLRPQADRLNVSDEDFGSAHTLETLETAIEIWWDALLDFFPSRLKEVLQVVVQEARRVGTAAKGMAQRAIETGKMQTALSAAADEAIAQLTEEFDRAFGEKSTDSQVSVASATSEHSASAN